MKTPKDSKFLISQNICTKGLTTCAAKILEQYTSAIDAAVIERINSAGAVRCENSSLVSSEFDLCGNNAGELLLSDDKIDFALTTSPRENASAQTQSGKILVGMKPTFGAVSRYGIVAASSSLEGVGPVTRTVAENAAVLHAIMGHDPRDAQSADKEYAPINISGSIGGMRIGVMNAHKEALSSVVKTLELSGAIAVNIDIPHYAAARAAHEIILCAEAASNLAKYDGILGRRAAEYANVGELYSRSRGEGFGSDAKRAILFGNFCLSKENYESYYVKASKVRTLIIRGFENALKMCDVILTPVCIGNAPDSLNLNPPSLAGLPALAVVGSAVGVQIIAPRFCEERCYFIGCALENIMGGSK